jgi:sulfite reductase alpha subunit-like flavoprotein
MIGSNVFNHWRQVERPTLLDILATFPSVTLLPLGALLEHLLPLAPRYYSLSYTPKQMDLMLSKPKHARFAFTLAKYTLPGGIERPGICTSWLNNISPGGIANNQGTTSGNTWNALNTLTRPILFGFQRNVANNYFSLPENYEKLPIVMVAAGTGLSPFISFINEVSLRIGHSKDDDNSPSNFYLFYGCRNPKDDFLFKDEIDGFLSNGSLRRCFVTFSRVINSDLYNLPKDQHQGKGENDVGWNYKQPSNHLRYVQHMLQHQAAALYDLMANRGAFLFVCGYF